MNRNLEQLLAGSCSIVGKTKRGFTDLMALQNLGVVTAQDGKTRLELPEKAAFATTFAFEMTEFVARHGKLTHLVAKLSDDTLLVRRAEMLPVELVVRRVIGPASSYRKVHSGLPEGNYRLPQRTFQMYLKDDENHDPEIIREEDGSFALYAPKVPRSEGYLEPIDLKTLYPEGAFESEEDFYYALEREALEIEDVVNYGFVRIGLDLQDIKLEMGLIDGRLAFCDTICPDEFRAIDEAGTEYSKQPFRDADTSFSKEAFLGLYEDAAKLAEQLRQVPTRG